MKRRIAWLLTCSLIMMSILPVNAVENTGGEAASGYTAEQEPGGNDVSRSERTEGGVEQDQTGSPSPVATPARTPDAEGDVQATQTPAPGNQADPSGTGEDGVVPGSPAGGAAGEGEGSPSPTASVTPTAFPTSSASPSATASQTPSPSATATPSVSPSTFSVNGNWNDTAASTDPAGGVEVALRNALPARVGVAVSLEDGGGQQINGGKTVNLVQDAKKESVFFYDLTPGEYTLKLSASGFLPYEQRIQVSGGVISTAEVHTGFVELDGFSYDAASPHPGVMLIGDVDGNGILDDSDRDAIMEAIRAAENGAAGTADKKTDLDGSGKTDLVDLQLFTNSRARLNAGAHTQATLSRAVAPGAVKVNYNADTTTVQGDPESILRGDNAGELTLGNRANTVISSEAPVEVGFNLTRDGAGQDTDAPGREMEQIVISMGGESVQSGSVFFETDEGPVEVEIRDGRPVSAARVLTGSDNRQSGAQGPGITIDLGGQIAVKKVTFKITAMNNNATLAEISKVEFLNDTENRIPEPEMNVPTGLTAKGGDKSFALTWDAQRNITGYEVEIRYDGKVESVRASSNNLEVKSFQGGKLKNNEIYQVRVRSVNGNWSSPWSDPPVLAVPVVTRKPSPPDNVRATGGYRCVRMSWKDMEDTDSYNVFYRKAGDASFIKAAERIGQNRFEITGLEDETRYEVYVTGLNDLGESNPSLISEARTITLKPAKMPEYKLINKSNGKGKVSAHITGATHVRGEMISSPLDTAGSGDASVPAQGNRKSALGTVDKDFGSGYQVLDWDDGAAYVSPDKGLLFTLDDYYKMSYIAFAETEDLASYGRVSVYYYDQEHPDGAYAQGANVLQRTDENGRKFYLIKLEEPITANKIRLGFARSYNLRNIVIAEVNFYYYDSLEDDILALYGDDLHTTLKEDVTLETINGLQQRLDTKDPESGEYHPERSVLQRELDNARGLLETGFNDVVQINPNITPARDSHLGFGGLNAWQPLGVTAYEGEKIVIYVGHNQLKTGSDTALKLIATQYHAEAGALASEVATLKVGRNEVTIPAIQSLSFEGGGPLYIKYTGNNASDRYAVRVNGGAHEPVLNLWGVADDQERRKLVTDYVRALDEHVASQERLHQEIHETAGENNKVNRKYDKQNCILGATEIMLDQMMLSVSGEQILAGLGKGDLESRAQKLDDSLRAMDDMMAFFYQHKGLGDTPDTPATDRAPAQHLNIRYMRMFAGAFMYASGNHIGIEWGSVSGLATSSPVVTGENGEYVSGRYFGWGIAHEIGHNINQGSYAIAEVTNNYFAQLAQARDTNATVRFKYPEVYKKVTSNTVGRPSNVFTHLAMYWQLHLAYDRGYNFKTWDTWRERFDNLFYARVDSYSRNPSSAPGSLTLNGGADQNIMRLACAAAGKDLTEFFMRWGLVPDAETLRYAGGFEKEERALYYLTDDARAYEIAYGSQAGVKERNVIGAGSSVKVDGKIPNQVNISIQCDADPNVILGYEIGRTHYEDGKPVRQIVGFSTEKTWSDTVSTVNNRVMTYDVTAVDKFGYRSAAARLGDVRISHDGSHDKSLWTITTNMTCAHDGAQQEGTEEDPCAPEPTPHIYQIADNDYGNTYEGQSMAEDAVILIRFNQVLTICGLKYTVASGTPVSDYLIEVSLDGENWTQVKRGRFEGAKGSGTVYFQNNKQDSWIYTCEAAYVRFKALGQSGMNVSEIDLLGPTGDSISFGVREGDTNGAAGILKEDYTYEKKPGMEPKVIPAGSLVFTGSYKGNPAYNVVVLYDEEGSIVGGVNGDNELIAHQIILAKAPEEGMLGEVSDGIWIYWIEPENAQTPAISGSVRAQLYRVNDALTNEGQRLVSDTMPYRIPDVLPQITLRDTPLAEGENGGMAE